MNRLFVIPGHGHGDPGAQGGGLNEADLVRQLATRIKALGGDMVRLADFGRNYYADGGLNYESVADDEQVVELHMDAAPGARGGHVIVPDGEDYPDPESEYLALMVASEWPGRANALVARSDLANPNRAMARGLRYRLVENGFITDDGDRERFIRDIDNIARFYLWAFDIQEVAQGGDDMAPSIIEANDSDRQWFMTDRPHEITGSRDPYDPDGAERSACQGYIWGLTMQEPRIVHMDGWQVEALERVCAR